MDPRRKPILAHPRADRAKGLAIEKTLKADSLASRPPNYTDSWSLAECYFALRLSGERIRCPGFRPPEVRGRHRLEPISRWVLAFIPSIYKCCLPELARILDSKQKLHRSSAALQ